MSETIKANSAETSYEFRTHLTPCTFLSNTGVSGWGQMWINCVDIARVQWNPPMIPPVHELNDEGEDNESKR